MKFTRQPSIPTGLQQAAERWFAHAASEKLKHPGYLDLLLNLATNLTAVDDFPVVLSVSGSQGSGKSTLAGLLASLLDDVFEVSVVSLSLDDFYLTRAERERLASDVHPLLRVRGVPGTHDIALLESTLDRLRQGMDVEVPVFDKAIDDRAAETRRVSAADVVICEGWCWGARPQPASQLIDPVNSLESGDDPDRVWRGYVNAKLAEYQTVFTSDAFVYLRVPDIEAVYRWRWQQEQDLRATRSGGSAVMDEAGVRGFVAYYERITQWMLDDCPGRADVVVRLDRDHQIAAIAFAGDD